MFRKVFKNEIKDGSEISSIFEFSRVFQVEE